MLSREWRDEVNTRLTNAVAEARQAAAEAAEAHLHKLLHGVNPQGIKSVPERSADQLMPRSGGRGVVASHGQLLEADISFVQRTKEGIDRHQDASTALPQTAAEHLAASDGELLEAVAPAVQNKRNGQLVSQLLEAVAEQRQRVSRLELKLKSFA